MSESENEEMPERESEKSDKEKNAERAGNNGNINTGKQEAVAH